MPTISIHRPHHLPIGDARDIVDQVAATLRDRFGLDGNWQGDTLHFARTGVQGQIALQANAVDVCAELGMLLAPLKGMVESEIRRKLDEHFG